MNNYTKITKNLYSVGASDLRLSLFENLFPLPDGVSYNSYLLTGEKNVLFDTVDSSVSEIFLENVLAILDGRYLDYLVIHHMEPDHCANIRVILRLFPDVTLVGNAKTFQFLEQFNRDVSTYNKLEVKENDLLTIGEYRFRFIFAPMVHWPEVMFSYEENNAWLLSADAFGTFGALSGNIFADELDFEGRFLNEARRYYFNIVGKFGAQVMSLFKKLSGLPLNMLLPLHGPIFRNKKDIDMILSYYSKWASYEAEENGVCIVYASMYGNTAQAAQILASELGKQGLKNVIVYDVSKSDPSVIISTLFRVKHFVIASVTYNGDLYYKMKALLDELMALNYQKRFVSYIINQSWGGTALKSIKEIVEKGKEIEVIGENVCIQSSVNEESKAKLQQLAAAIVENCAKAC